MKLYLLRHAKTNQQSPTGNDFDRKLLPKGVAQCALMKDHLKGLENIRIWCSSAQRTRQTLDLIDVKSKYVSYFDDFYLCSKEAFLERIWDLEDADDLFIIGHNYGISELAGYLTDEYVELRTCEMICIEFDSINWSEVSRGLGTIVDRYRPHPSL